MLGLILAFIIAFFSMFIPGLLLAFALLKKSELHTFEIIVIGFIFGLIAPATLTWLEGYLITYVHAFTFSLWLFEANVLVLTIIGAVLCYREGVFKDFGTFIASRASESVRADATTASLGDVRHRLNRFSTGKQIVGKHIQEEHDLHTKHNSEISSASKLTDEERSRISVLHKETEDRLKESQLNEERMLLQELESKSRQVPETSRAQTFKPKWWVWALLLVLMLVTFYTRIQSIVVAPKFFEFDPYFDMIDAHYLLAYGKQLLLDPSAWPVVAGGTNHRLQPLVPYLEAYWYNLANVLQFHHALFSTSLMSYVGSVYPPITAALLVFVIFMLLYHEYDERIGLIGAGLTAMMPVLFTTFIAGEQLVEPWGIFSLFFFFATYMLAIRNMKDKRLAILAGIAFASTFLGAHYYTVTAGVLVLYILIQGIIDVLRKESLADFYKMNAIVIITIIILYALYAPYQATLQSNLSSVLGIPIIIAAPALALVLIAVLDQVPKQLAKRRLLIKEVNFKSNLLVMVIIGALLIAVILFTKVGGPVKSYINLSKRFTTASKPLFMTVQEYIPTGPIYSFGAQGFGPIGVGLFGIPYLVWIVCAVSVGFIFMSIAFRRSKTGILYIAVALPLMAAGFSEVKYLPHFGTTYILLFGITLGEIYFLASSNYYKSSDNSKRPMIIMLCLALGLVVLLASFSLLSFGTVSTIVLVVIAVVLLVLMLYFTQQEKARYDITSVYSNHPLAAQGVLLIGLFFIFGVYFAVAAFAFIAIYRYGIKHTKDNYNRILLVICAALVIFSFSSPAMFIASPGESGSILSAMAAQYRWATNSPTNACAIMSNNGNAMGYNLYCNTIPNYWLASMSWIRANVGPNAPRVLAWWDYGDWINWFGNTNAVLRGDNSVAKEDYAVAAQYVLGPKPITTANGTVSVSTPQSLAGYMNGNQTSYVLFDEDLISKWGALDFLGCVNVNATSMAYAIAQGQSQSSPVPYVLGTSQCEIAHDPEYILVPLSALSPSASNYSQPTINDYCSISTNTNSYIKGYMIIGNNLQNNTACVSATPSANGNLALYNDNGTAMNATIQPSNYLGVQDIQNEYYVQFLVVYLPNKSGVVVNPPSEFYDSNYYKGFVLGRLPGFKEVYPANATDEINFVNGTYPVRIYELLNYTGGLPLVPPKPPYIHNNDTMP